MAQTDFKNVPREIKEPAPGTPVLDWWDGIYDKVFIALNPFVRWPVVESVVANKVTVIDGKKYVTASVSGADGFDEDQATHAKKYGETTRWSDVHAAVCPEVPFEIFAQCVWISSCLGRRKDVPSEIQEAIGDYCFTHALFLPQDDIPEPALEPQIGRFLAALDITSVDVYDEFRANVFRCGVEAFSQDSPKIRLPQAITRDTYYCIHSKEAGLVMTWEFDGVEAFIGLTKNALTNARPEDYFEGFYADANTYSDWANPLDFCPRKPPSKPFS
ncbi:hypothetical protein [Labrenzia sp. PHM005]|uniref:hypothetical protein n=1 Tax=Labrenzia sp. PHM005 TaxID=2590016 RepID=UPI00114039FC|nr:hypothetical protein [Labrenzia sp. PHM005]QDG77884.1 hypothetical protein FJ695_19580 [Labrenzia sp. PHM005]